MSAKAWLLDFDGTLYRAPLVKLAMAAELACLGIPAVRILREFRKQHELLREQVAYEVDSPYHLQLEVTARALGIPVEEVERNVREWMIVRPGKWIRRFKRRALLDEIRAFRQNGGRTALVSDYPVQLKLASMGDASLFDETLACGEPNGPRRLKPHPDGYLAAARRLGVAPLECLVIGDREDADGRAAEAAGMQFRLIH